MSMSHAQESHTPVEVKPRRMSFPFSRVKKKFFFADNSLLSAFAAALSSTFPPGEAEFINSVRLFRDQISDEKLQEEIRGFIGQEGHHSHQHKRINEKVKELGLDAVRLEKHLEKDIKKFLKNKKRSDPKVRLAMTVGMEHLTAIMAQHLLENPEVMDGLDESVQELMLWHAVEEIEHKSVAFDVYMQSVGDRALLRRVLRIATVMFTLRISAYMVALLWWARTVPSWKDFKGLYAFMFGKQGLIPSIRKPYSDYFKPNFHPWDHENRHLIEQWKQNTYKAKHDRGSDAFEAEPEEVTALASGAAA